MGFYPEKPVRVDYFPKTKEDIKEFEKIKIEDYLDGKSDCKIIDGKGFKKDEITECKDFIVEDIKGVGENANSTEKNIEDTEKNVEDMEEAIEKITKDMEEAIENMAEDKKEN